MPFSRLALAGVLACVVWATDRPASACSCAEPEEPRVALAHADAVFLGSVTGQSPVDEKFRPMVAYRLDVLASWKGPATGLKVSVHSEQISRQCGKRLDVGKVYLVYASNVDGHLYTSMCTRTQLKEGAQEDLKALGPPQK